MWDLPRPGLEPVSPALAGRFSTTVPPGKPPDKIFIIFRKKVTGNKSKSFKINERFRNPYNSLMVVFGLTIQASFNPTKILGSRAHRFAHQSTEGAGAQGFLILLARLSFVIAAGIKNSSNNTGKAQARNYMQVVNTSNS